jgi:hypothetical protein
MAILRTTLGQADSSVEAENVTTRSTNGYFEINKSKLYALDEAVKAPMAQRSQAGLGAEMFSLEAFVGTISDEVESLRKQGHTDDVIGGYHTD